MIRHLARLSAISLLVVACMVFPFLPGEHDRFATTLSGIAQLFVMVGLLLVPLGAIWLAYELRSRAVNTERRPGTKGQYWFALATIGLVTILGAIVSLGAFASVGPSLGVGALALLVWFLARVVPKLRAMKSAEVHTFNVTPLYLVVIPIVAVISRFALIGPASELSRNRAMENSASLISDIERFRDSRGHYPLSLLAVWKDYKTGVIGIERYHYEPNGEAYNVYFENLSDRFGTREFVMYNKRDEHEMTSHTMDLLVATPAELAAQRGYYAVQDALRPHWKRFLFD